MLFLRVYNFQSGRGNLYTIQYSFKTFFLLDPKNKKSIVPEETKKITFYYKTNHPFILFGIRSSTLLQ